MAENIYNERLFVSFSIVLFETFLVHGIAE